jgi:cytochrome c oxidase subunit 2
MNNVLGRLIGSKPFLGQLPDSFWLPAQASSTASEVDTVFYVIYVISVIFFALIVGLMVTFVVQFRRRKGYQAEDSPHHSTKLEVAWTVVPILLSILIFYLGFKSFLNITTPPAGSYEISVTGQKWQWFFSYPNGHIATVLHVPVDRPVKLTMTSEDVIHSLFIPAFRIKQDLVPGRYTKAWFKAIAPGIYPLLCTEYCGTGHSDMLTTVVVHAAGEFETWLSEASDQLDGLPPSEAGEILYQTRGCTQCHTVTGAAGIGPTFKDMYGATYQTKDGQTIVADDNYIRESVLDPQASLIAGFEPVMPTYQGKFKDKEITMLIAYFKSISKHYSGDDEVAAGDATVGAAVTDPSAAASRQEDK